MRGTLPLGLLVLVLVLGGVGCGRSTRPCKSGTLFLTLQLDTVTGAADQLRVDITLGATTKSGSLAHRPGAFDGSVEVDFAGTYPANQTVTVTVTALRDGTALGAAAERLILGSVCSALSLSIGGGDVVDLGVADLERAPDGGAVGAVGDGGGDGSVDLGSPLGAPCLPGTCGAGLQCVDGVCCDGACTGTCEACDISGSIGHCTAATGTPHGRRPTCTGTSTGAGAVCAGSCNGTLRSDCTYPPSSTNCVAASCTSGVHVAAVYCDGAGSCPSPVPTNCLEGECSGTTCTLQCTDDTQCAGATPFCDSGACTAHLPTGRGCTTGTQCNTGNCVGGVCCDQPCTGACQACSGTVGSTTVTPGTCTAVSGLVCRPSAGVCDVAESCTGSSADCPADGFAPTSTVCHNATDVCDVTQYCTGTQAACPPDSFLSSSTVCRASTGGCDPAEYCPGNGPSCPANVISPSGTVCANPTDCLNAATCTGSVTCPAPTAKANGTACDSANDKCCTGGAEACSDGVCKTSGCCNTETCCRE